MKSQLQLFYEAQRRIADGNEQFLDLVREGLTKAELQRNIERRPELWERFSNWLEVLL